MTAPVAPPMLPAAPVRQPKPVAAGLVLVAVALALFFSNLGAHDLWAPDEVRYALVAREMRAGGDYILPRLNGDVYQEKPPLMFWLTTACAETYGRWVEWRRPGRGPRERAASVNEVTARLPSAFAALCTLLLVWRAGARRWDEWTGLVAALILATSVQFFWFSRNGALDAVLTLWVTIAILSGVRALDADRRWGPWSVGVLAGMTAGLLTKGPVALLIPAVVLGSYGWTIGRPRRAGILLAGAAACALLLVAPWWRAAYARSGGAFGSLDELLRQTTGRLVTSYSHQKPVYHYAVGLLGEFLPWSVFLPTAVWAAVRARGTVEWPRLRLAWCWVVAPFLVFSAISGKRGQYLLPIYPGLALLVAAHLRQYASDLRRLPQVRRVMVPTLLLSIGTIATGMSLVVLMLLTRDGIPATAGPTWSRLRHELDGAGPLLRTLADPGIGGGIAFSCLGAWALLHHLPRPPSRVIPTIVVLTTLVLGVCSGIVLPAFDSVKSARGFAETVRGWQHMAGANAQVVLFHSFRADIAFYYGRHLEIDTPPAITTADTTRPGPLLAIIEEKHYDRYRDTIPDRFVLVHRDRIGSRIWVLLTNRPPAT